MTNLQENKFGIVDYIVLSLMLLISSAIGLYYRCGPGLDVSILKSLNDMAYFRINFKKSQIFQNWWESLVEHPDCQIKSKF